MEGGGLPTYGGPSSFGSLLEYQLTQHLGGLGTLPVFEPPIDPKPAHRLLYRESARVNRQTVASKVVEHPLGLRVEWPETDKNYESEKRVGVAHVFTVDPADPTTHDPRAFFAYSLGNDSHGAMPRNKPVYTPMLLDKDGNKVPCIKRHYKCGGVKVCPQYPAEAKRTPHHIASRNDIRDRLADHRSAGQSTNVSREILDHTLALFKTLQDNGCTFTRHEQTELSVEERQQRERSDEFRLLRRRNQPDNIQRCEGRIFLVLSHNEEFRVRCEHYDARYSRNHLNLDTVGYDIDLLQSLFDQDQDALAKIEMAAKAQGYGPLAPCWTLANASDQRRHCGQVHRVRGTGELGFLELENIECDVKFMTYTPHDLASCPRVLVHVKGTHCHPVPAPKSTPKPIIHLLWRVLSTVGPEIFALTGRSIQRSHALQSELKKVVPWVDNPIPGHLHPSLFNLQHLGDLTRQLRDKIYPAGGGWDGLHWTLETQHKYLDPKLHYLRAADDLEYVNSKGESVKHRFAVCMTSEMSFGFLGCPVIQIDSSYKRLADPNWVEFSIATRDLETNTVMVLTRCPIESESAEVHRAVLHAVRRTVFLDTNKNIVWEYMLRAIDNLYADTELGEYWQSIRPVGIRLVLMDLGRGQAKGLDLFLHDTVCDLANQGPFYRAALENICTPIPYQQLSYCARACSVHSRRRVLQSKASRDAKIHMLHLVRGLCSEAELEEAQIEICRDPHGLAWWDEKIDGGFALAAMCQARSNIPLEDWIAGPTHDNDIETSHQDVYREAKGQSLVAALYSGFNYDRNKELMRSAAYNLGISPSYRSVDPTSSLQRPMERQVKRIQASNQRADEQYQKQHEDVIKATDRIAKASRTLLNLKSGQFSATSRKSHSEQLLTAEKALERAQGSLDKILNRQIGHGSGHYSEDFQPTTPSPSPILSPTCSPPSNIIDYFDSTLDTHSIEQYLDTNSTLFTSGFHLGNQPSFLSDTLPDMLPPDTNNGLEVLGSLSSETLVAPSVAIPRLSLINHYPLTANVANPAPLVLVAPVAPVAITPESFIHHYVNIPNMDVATSAPVALIPSSNVLIPHYFPPTPQLNISTYSALHGALEFSDDLPNPPYSPMEHETDQSHLYNFPSASSNVPQDPPSYYPWRITPNSSLWGALDDSTP